MWRTTGLLVVANRLLQEVTKTENFKHFKQRVVSKRTVRLFSGQTVTPCHSSRNFAHAHVSYSQQGLFTDLWTVQNNVRFSHLTPSNLQNTVVILSTRNKSTNFNCVFQFLFISVQFHKQGRLTMSVKHNYILYIYYFMYINNCPNHKHKIHIM